MTRKFRQERCEVLNTGKLALYYLKAAKADLDSASNWGIFDICVGGLFSTMIKHQKINSAKEKIRIAMKNLQMYRNPSDRRDYVNEDYLHLGSFATFSDYVFDSIFSDLYVQAKIDGLRDRLTLAIDRVENLLKEYECR